MQLQDIKIASRLTGALAIVVATSVTVLALAALQVSRAADVQHGPAHRPVAHGAGLDSLGKPAGTVADDAGEPLTASVAGLLWGGAGVVLAVGVAATVALRRTVVAPLRRAVDLAAAVAGGDLTVRIDTHGDNETSRLLQSLKDVQVRLLGPVVARAEPAQPPRPAKTPFDQVTRRVRVPALAAEDRRAFEATAA